MNKYGVIILAALLPILLPGCREQDTAAYYQGYIYADLIYVAAPVAGRLAQLPVARGKQVVKGDLLYQIAPEPDVFQQAEADAALRQTKAQVADLQKGARPEDLAVLEEAARQKQAALELANLDVQRISDVYSNSYVSASENDQAFYARQQAEAALQQALRQLDQARLGARKDQIAAMKAQADSMQSRLDAQAWMLREKTQLSPAEATVYDTLYREGEWIPAGHPVVALLAPDNIRIRFYASSRRAATLKIGQAVRYAQGPEGPLLTARISYVSPTPEYAPPVIFSRDTSDKQVFMIEATPDNPREAFHPGLPVEVYDDKDQG